VSQARRKSVVKVVDDLQTGQRLDSFLAASVEGVSRSRIGKLINQGLVLIGDHPETRCSVRLKAGDRVSLEIPGLRDPDDAPEAEAIQLHIVFEDEDLIVINKAAGMVVHPAPGSTTGTLVNALLHAIPDLPGIGGIRRPGIVHRLDKDTTGLLVVAKSERALLGLQEQFKERSVEKIYQALVYRGPKDDAGTIDAAIARHPKDRKRFSSRDCQNRPDARAAVTHYQVVERFRVSALLELKLETGRTHQIRVHLLDSGFPILGDSVYSGRGKGRRVPSIERAEKAVGHQALHSWKLSFKHPASEEAMSFEVPPPKEFEDAIGFLRE